MPRLKEYTSSVSLQGPSLSIEPPAAQGSKRLAMVDKAVTGMVDRYTQLHDFREDTRATISSSEAAAALELKSKYNYDLSENALNGLLAEADAIKGKVTPNFKRRENAEKFEASQGHFTEALKTKIKADHADKIMRDAVDAPKRLFETIKQRVGETGIVDYAMFENYAQKVYKMAEQQNLGDDYANATIRQSEVELTKLSAEIALLGDPGSAKETVKTFKDVLPAIDYVKLETAAKTIWRNGLESAVTGVMFGQDQTFTGLLEELESEQLSGGLSAITEDKIDELIAIGKLKDQNGFPIGSEGISPEHGNFLKSIIKDSPSNVTSSALYSALKKLADGNQDKRGFVKGSKMREFYNEFTKSLPNLERGDAIALIKNVRVNPKDVSEFSTKMFELIDFAEEANSLLKIAFNSSSGDVLSKALRMKLSNPKRETADILSRVTKGRYNDVVKPVTPFSIQKENQ